MTSLTLRALAVGGVRRAGDHDDACVSVLFTGRFLQVFQQQVRQHERTCRQKQQEQYTPLQYSLELKCLCTPANVMTAQGYLIKSIIRSDVIKVYYAVKRDEKSSGRVGIAHRHALL